MEAGFSYSAFSGNQEKGIELGYTDVLLRIGISEKLGAFVETFGRFNNDMVTNSIDGGFTFLLLPNLQFDISGAIGITDSAVDYYAGAGFSFRLP